MHHFHTVRTYRKRFALSQGELADLLTVSQPVVSRLESDSTTSTLEAALGLQVIFNAQPRVLFPHLYESVEDAVMRQATALDERIRGKTDAASVKKQRLLDAMVKRAKVASIEP